MTSIITKIRNILQDNLVLRSDIFTYDNSSVFTFTENNVSSISEVYINDVSSGVTYTTNSLLTKITISSPMTSGDTVQVDFYCYSKYSDTELTAYIKIALYHLGLYNYCDFIVESGDLIYPTPTANEENLIALIAAILIEPNNESIRLPDLSISTANKLSTQEQIDRTISRFKKNTHGIFGLAGG